ncbi:CBS domain-containing protein [Chondromyces crocatus]|uniref:CBS domain-containing protein n=1 Tax=Chondromyces crocatus TaxID=52 RepID=A0A0K1EBB0_CHOCO|nr:CBS domain-containing protein [Chondromyces crocatus]AKT37868.1 uncharacterized protein CMC5_020110 [Chondromyces crocatus]
MRLREVMATKVEWVSPDTTVEEAAQRMKRLDVGALPVCEDGRLIGMLTDRDIVVRGVSAGYDMPRATVGQLASRELLVGHEEQHVDEAIRMMESRRVRRLPIVDAERRLVGIVTVADLAAQAQKGEHAARIVAIAAHPRETAEKHLHHEPEQERPRHEHRTEDVDPAERRGRGVSSDNRGEGTMADRYGMGRHDERSWRGREDERRGGMGGRDYETSQHRGYGDRDMDSPRGGREHERGTGRDYDELQRVSYSRDYDRHLRGHGEPGPYGQQRGFEQGGFGRGQRGFEQGHQRSFGGEHGWESRRGHHDEGRMGYRGGRAWDEEHERRPMYGEGMMGRGYGGQESRMYGNERGYGERGYGGEGRSYEPGGGGMGHMGHQGWEHEGHMGHQGWEHQGRSEGGMGPMGWERERMGSMGSMGWDQQGRMGHMGHMGPIGHMGWEHERMGSMGQPGSEYQGRFQGGMGNGGFGMQQGMKRGPKGYKRSDDRIREEICDRLTVHPIIDSSDVEVKVQSGEVSLSGTVAERRHKHLIEQLAEAISGVNEVRNEIRVKRNETSMESRGQETQRGTSESSMPGKPPMAQASQGRNAS